MSMLEYGFVYVCSGCQRIYRPLFHATFTPIKGSHE
jgi:hypothetical protein